MTLAPLTLTPNQEEDVARMLADQSGGVLIASELGTGKTVVAVEYVIRHGDRRVLVACPLATRIGWQRTFERQGSDLPVYRIDSTKAGKEGQARYEAKEEGIFLVGHSMFRRRIGVFERKALFPDVFIYDEVQDVCNYKSEGFKALKKVRAKQRIGISGTWFGNKFANSWAPPRWLWYGLPGDTASDTHIDSSFHRWKVDWAVLEHDPHNKSEHGDNRKVVAEKDPGAWANYLPLYIRREATYDTSVVSEDIYVELSRSQRKAYDDLERDALTWLKDHPLVTDLPITTRIRMRQFTLGDLSFEEDGGVGFALDCKSAKLDALVEFLANRPGENVLIYTDSKRFAKVVVDRLGDKAREWSGDTPQPVRENLISKFGADFNYLVATIAAMGAGVDGLQHVCNTVVWLSQSEDASLNEQALGRLHRTGQTKDVLSIYIKAVDTLDEGVYGRLLATTLANRTSMTEHNSRVDEAYARGDIEMGAALHDALAMFHNL